MSILLQPHHWFALTLLNTLALLFTDTRAQRWPLYTVYYLLVLATDSVVLGFSLARFLE